MLRVPASISKLIFRHLSSQNRYEMVRVISKADVEQFAQLTGDTNPVHFEGEAPIVHGALLIGIVSGVIGTKYYELNTSY